MTDLCSVGTVCVVNQYHHAESFLAAHLWSVLLYSCIMRDWDARPDYRHSDVEKFPLFVSVCKAYIKLNCLLVSAILRLLLYCGWQLLCMPNTYDLPISMGMLGQCSCKALLTRPLTNFCPCVTNEFQAACSSSTLSGLGAIFLKWLASRYVVRFSRKDLTKGWKDFENLSILKLKLGDLLTVDGSQLDAIVLSIQQSENDHLKLTIW